MSLRGQEAPFSNDQGGGFPGGAVLLDAFCVKVFVRHIFRNFATRSVRCRIAVRDNRSIGRLWSSIPRDFSGAFW